MMQFARGNIKKELEAINEAGGEGTEIQNITMYKLMQAFDKVTKRMNERLNKPQHIVTKYQYTMEGQRAYLITYMQQHLQVPFQVIFDKCETRIHAIFNFLALLELAQQKIISFLLGDGRNNFIVKWVSEENYSTILAD